MASLSRPHAKTSPPTVQQKKTYNNFVTSVDLSKQHNAALEGQTGYKRPFSLVDNATISPRFAPEQGLRASRIVKCSENTDDTTSCRPGSTPRTSQHPLLSLANAHYGLPSRLVENFGNLGVKAIYPWQSSCLLRSGVLSHPKNLIYTAPTGGGKSLVADVVLLQKIVQSPSKKALLVLPYVALVQEKTRWLRRLVEGLHRVDPEGPPYQLQQTTSKEICVAAFYGGTRSKTNWNGCDVAVCTIEKANMLINSAIEDGTIDDLGIVVCDELHMLDDEHRGYILELMLAKILTLQLGVQIVGMSATLANPGVIAEWLHAKFFVAKYRPIPIHEHMVYDNAIYSSADPREFLRLSERSDQLSPTQLPSKRTHIIEESPHKELSNPVLNAVVALAAETAEEGFGALIFCSSRTSTQTIACLIARTLEHIALDADVVENRIDVLTSLQALPGGFEPCLSETIPHGVGFHHAGLTVEERDIIAEAYDKGLLKVMVATCSLAAGINLPARRVILNSARMGRDLVGPAMLRQMRGRAGRKGKDEVGETFLCCQKLELEPVAEMLEAELPAVVSCLTPEKRGFKRAILEVVGIGMLSTYENLQEYARNSLLWQTVQDHKMILDMLDSAITGLLRDRLIEVTENDTYTPTALGSAIVASGLTPEDGLFVHADLRQALSSFVMDSELHLLYLFTPIPAQTVNMATTHDISWTVFRDLLGGLDDASVRALQHVGIKLALVDRLANDGAGNLPERTSAEIRTARVYRRVYSTFALRDICNEMPINKISLRYDLPRGTIQNLAQACHGFAAGMIKFCQRMASHGSSGPLASVKPDSRIVGAGTPGRSVLSDGQASGFSMLAAVLEHMQSRLYAGARADLLDMAQVTFVKGRMARLLWENGFKSVRALSEADPQRDILPIMMSICGWKLKQIERDVQHEDDGPEEQQMHGNALYAIRKSKLEEKLLGKAEVMVRSAGLIYEREVLRSAYLEEE